MSACSWIIPRSLQDKYILQQILNRKHLLYERSSVVRYMPFHDSMHIAPLDIVLSVLRFTDSDYPFGIFKLF